MASSLPDVDFIVEDVVHLSSWKEGIAFVKEHGYKTRGLNNLEQIKDFLLSLIKKDDNQLQTIDYSLEPAIKHFPEIKKQLLTLIPELEKLFLIPTVFNEFIHPKSKQKTIESIRKLKNELNKSHCFILVAGESNAGKSSFINLIIGEKILPEDNLSCTRIICFLHNSKEKKVVFQRLKKSDNYFGNDEDFVDGHSEEDVISFENFTDEERKKIFDRITVANDEMTQPQYDEAHFYWPIDFLENTVCLVDSPGLRERCSLDDVTLTFLDRNCAAFILVLDATNCGGLNFWSRQLLKKCREKLDRVTIDDPWLREAEYKKAIFIINKWDKIESDHGDEKEETKNFISKQLNELWPNIQFEKQVVFMSVLQLTRWAKESKRIPKTVIDIHCQVKNMVGQTLESIIQRSLHLTSRPVQEIESCLWERIITNIGHHFNHEEQKKNFDNSIKALQTIQKTADSKIEQLLQEITNLFKEKSASFCEYLVNESDRHLNITPIKVSLSSNSLMESDKKSFNQQHASFSKIDDSITTTTTTTTTTTAGAAGAGGTARSFSEDCINIASKQGVELFNTMLIRVINEKILEEIELWDKKCKLIHGKSAFEDLHDKFSKLFVDKFQCIDSEVDEMKSIITNEGLNYLLRRYDDDILRQYRSDIVSTFEKALLITSCVFLIPIVAVGAVFAAPFLGFAALQDHQDKKRLLSKIKTNPTEYIENTYNLYLTNLTSQPQSVYEQFFKPIESKFVEKIKKLKEHIQELIGDREQKLENLNQQTITVVEMDGIFRPIIKECHRLLGMVDYIKFLYRTEPGYELAKTTNELNEEKDLIILAQSVYSKTFVEKKKRGKKMRIFWRENWLRDNQTPRPFQAFENWKALLNAESEGFLHLRAIEKQTTTISVMHVFEYECQHENASITTLQKYLETNSHLIPVNCEEKSQKVIALRQFVDFSHQIAIALLHLNSMPSPLVSTDLRPETILAIQDGETVLLKINDFGYEKRLDIGMTENAEARCYLPPEVYKGFGCYKKADVFSLGMIMWQVYYFEKKLESLSEYNRMSVSLTTNPSLSIGLDFSDQNMPENIKNLINDCLLVNPGKRPSLTTVIDTLKIMKTEYQNMEE